MSEASPSTFSKIKSLVSNNKKQFIGGLILLIIIIGLIIYFVLSKKQNQIILVVSSNCAKCPEEIERFNTTWKDPNNPDAKTAKASIVDKDTKKGRKITKKYKIDAFPSIIAINKKGEYLIMDLSGSSDDNLLAKVADAVQVAHARGVLHRDLKPSNILIDGAGRPHVSDFGLAKRLEAADSVTFSGAILGTPCYMSPEQAAGSRGDVGPASDVWSLGAILYQMLTGRPPFEASSPMDTLLAVLETDPPLPRTLEAGVDRDLEMIALKSLQKPQELRYHSAGALAGDLRAFLAGEPIAARQGGLADIAARLFRETHHAVVLENWGLLWMWHSVVVLALCVTTDVLAWQGVATRWPFSVLWAGGLALWAPIFWALRRRTGPVTAVERQIAHIWGGAMIASVLLFGVEGLLGLPVLTLSPVLALLAGLVFFAKAGILSGAFYIQAAVLFATALVMCLVRTDLQHDITHIIFGLVSGACFFLPGLKYFRQRNRAGLSN